MKAEHDKGMMAINEISALMINVQKDIKANSSGVQQNEEWIKENRDFLNDLRYKTSNLENRIEEEKVNNDGIEDTLAAYRSEINKIADNVNQSNMNQ